MINQKIYQITVETFLINYSILDVTSNLLRLV